MLRIFKQYYPARNFFFAFGEGLFIFIAVLLASLIVLGMDSFIIQSNEIYAKAFLITIVCQVCLYYNDLYNLKVSDSLAEMSIRLLQSLGVATIILALVYFIFPASLIAQGIYFVSIGIVLILLVLWRLGYTIVLKRGLFNQKILILGSSKLAEDIFYEIKDTHDCGYEVSLLVPDFNDNSDLFQQKFKDTMIKKNYEGICEVSKDLGIKKIVVALKEKRESLPIKELLWCRTSGIEILEGASFYEMLTGKLLVQQITPGWLIFSEGFRKSLFLRLFKRIGDILLSSIMLFLLLPLLLFVAILIRLDSNGPVFFSQERVGQKRKLYKVHKFRSMQADAEKTSGPVWAQNEDDRVTRVGNFIRKWRIDEMPQLWNVLKGEMSFVGPRPERDFFVRQLEDVIPYYGERFTVKPGVTGWAQISYPYGASVEDAMEKLNYDLFYIKNMSTLMDLMIVVRTIKTVLFGEGAR